MPTSGAEGPFIAFGQWIREQREAAGLTSQPRAEIRARAKGLTLINQGKLSHIERGQNGNPDPDFLKQLATLYRLKYVDVVARWMQVRYAVGSDAISVPTSHGAGAHSTLQTGGGDRDTATRERLEELEGKVLVYEAIIATARALTTQLAAAVGNEGDQGGNPPPRGGRGTRKNR